MRNIIYGVHTSIDGFIDGPNGEFDWPTMGGAPNAGLGSLAALAYTDRMEPSVRFALSQRVAAVMSPHRAFFPSHCATRPGVALPSPTRRSKS